MMRRAPWSAWSFAALALAMGLAGCAGQKAPRILRQPPSQPPVRPSSAPPVVTPTNPPKSTPVVTEPKEAPAKPKARKPRALPQGNPLLKIGIASDLPSVVLPCCDGEVVLQLGDSILGASSPFRVEPAAGSGEAGVFRLQIAALRDERQAEGLARRLSEQTGQPASVHFDAGVDLYRVRVGKYASRDDAEAERRRLGSIGVVDAWVISEGAKVSDPAMRVTQGANVTVRPGRWLSVETRSPRGLSYDGKRYRGRLLVFLNDRGSLNLINELPLEEYLRGVVPSELGPEAYPRIEAIKAQAVAARTYTLRNLGEFAREGYDICATPRCQVYGGLNAEHPVSDRAISETAGQVMTFEGELVDALYSSTCGGHTEDVEQIFPLKAGAYLRAVPCVEAGSQALAGDVTAGAAFPDALTRRLFPPSEGLPTAMLEARLEHVALLAGFAAPRERLASLDRREIQRFLFAAFDLGQEASLLMAREDVPYLLRDAPASWSEEDRKRAAYLRKVGLLGGALDANPDAGEQEKLLLALGERYQVLRREVVSFLSVEGTNLAVRAGKEDRVDSLGGSIATFRRVGSEVSAGPLALVAGDQLTLFWRGASLVAVLQDVDLAGVAFDRSSKYSSWTRFRSDAQLAALVQQRFPGMGFLSLEILTRGASGRVSKLKIQGTEGRNVVVEGLPIRWTLDVPDTLFTAKRLEPPQGESGWLFTGRGWGHGVGMCQVGAYGMAQRGHGYREILTHYYRGVEIGRLGEPTSVPTESPTR